MDYSGLSDMDRMRMMQLVEQKQAHTLESSFMLH